MSRLTLPGPGAPGLSIDATEEAALSGELSRCPDVPITVSTAR
ncbi:hypothetical protein NHG22_11340 [Streptomyces sp. ATE26]|nr:hypothetical protein [Streptomyces sp. ATE26]MDI1454398.1 hypothetical protein [Streptomyces sp. ATE26]